MLMKKMRSDLKNVNSTNPAPSSVALESVRELASHCSASHEDSCFKENININKSDTPKLAMEPLQMKKKKKGGGYNLRKSLAWDRAFFTEEGVLDPLELSLISGASCGEGLPFISEDTPVKNNPLEGLPDEDLGKDGRKNFLSSNSDSSSSKSMISTSPSSHKVSARAGSKSGSRCGDCPRPLPTSSLKRPAHVNVSKAAAKNLKLLKVPGSKAVLSPLYTTMNSNILRDKRLKEPANASKAASRELKLPKIPVSKAVRSPVCATTESTILRADTVKHNQIAQPDFNTQKNAGLKSSSESPRTTQNASKASSLVSAHHSTRNSGNTSLKRYSSVNASPGLVDKAENSGPRMISDNMTPARVHSSESQDKLTTFAAPSSESAFVGGRTMQPSQNQSAKPSGLRIPSPSLSFFSQPQASVLYKLSSRTTHTDVCGSQRPGSLISRDNSRGKPKVDNIPESTSSCGRAVGSNSGCLAPCHVNVVSHDIIKSNSEVNSLQKVGMKEVYDAFNSDPIGNKLFKGSSFVFDGHDQDLSKKSKSRRISREEELQKIDNEMPSQSGNCEQLMNDNCPVKIELPGSGWRNPELISQQSYTLHESETRIAINEPRKEQNTCNLLILNQGAIKGTQCEDVFDHRRQGSLELQSDMEEMCKPDFCESGGEETDQLIYSPRETDKRTHQDKKALKTDDGAGEQLGVSQQSGSWSSGIGAAEALEHRRVKAKSSYLESKHQNADLLKEATFMDVMTDKLLAGEAHTQDAICALIIDSCKNNINLISEVGDGTKQPGKDLEVQSVCRKGEVEFLGKVEFNTSDKLLPDNQICIRKSQEEENIKKPLFVLLDRKAGNRLIDTKMARTQSPADMHDCNLDKDKMMKQPLVSTQFYSSDNPLSSESHNNLINTTFSNDGIDRGKANSDASSSKTMMSMVAVDERWQDDNLRSNEPIIGPPNENLSISLYQDAQTMEIDYCSSLPESRPHEVSQKNFLGKLTDTEAMLEDGCGNNLLTSTIALKEGGSNMDDLRNIGDSGTVLVHSPENNMLNKCCFKQPEYLAYPDDEIVSEDIVHTNDGLHFENYLRTESSASEESYIDNALGSMEDSVTGKKEIHVGSLTDSSISAHDSPLKHESCNDAYGTDGLSCIADTTRDPSRVEPFPETTKSEVSEDTKCSVSEIHIKLNKENVEVALAQNNKDDDDLNEKSRTLVIPKNAVPFSDEWLAAIEAAGEDILTKKSGAVQNSPTEKSLPEPSPWSPVKKKNNQIGPFDCTKFTNILPSDSN